MSIYVDVSAIGAKRRKERGLSRDQMQALKLFLAWCFWQIFSKLLSTARSVGNSTKGLSFSSGSNDFCLPQCDLKQPMESG